MLTTMIVPEVLLRKAWSDLGLAEVKLKALQRFTAIDGVPQTLTYSLFANIRGFVIRANTSRTRGMLALISNRTQTELAILASESNVNSKSAQINKSTLALSYSNPFYLIASEIHRLREASLLAKLPHVTINKINNKSKGNSFT